MKLDLGSAAWPRVTAALALFTGLGLLTLLGGGCGAAFRLPAESLTPTAPKEQILSERMNPFVLTNLVSDRLVFEIDWVAGSEPEPEALEELERTLRGYLPEDKRIEIDLDDEIPLNSWNAVPGGFLDKSSIYSRFLDSDPRAWEEAELIYVVYAPWGGEYLGWMEQLHLERDGRFVLVPTIFLFVEQIHKQAAWPVGAERVERAVLVHEIGHVIGLVSAPDHQERGNPRHCTEPRCVVTHQRFRTQLYNAVPALFAGSIPDDFCKRCREDIRTAKLAWAARSAADRFFPEELRLRRQAWELRNEARWLGGQERFSEAALLLQEARKLTDGLPGCFFQDFEQLRKPDKVLQLYPPCSGE